MHGFASSLSDIVGSRNVFLGDTIEPRYRTDWTAGEAGAPAFVVRPESTVQVAEVVRLCARARQPVVVQGGRTGMVRGALARPGELVVSLERMAAIEEIRPIDGVMLAQAGVILQTAQEAADAAGFSLPLDLGGRGSCTLGGVISTNAGGNRVLRYGMARDFVLGLEAVLGDGTVLSSLNRMIKNNAGYDLKHMLIGSEGTLGIITKAVLRLRPRVASDNLAVCALGSFDSAVALLHRLNSRLGGQVSAFEAMWPDFYRFVTENGYAPARPLHADFPLFALVEMQGGEPESDRERFVEALGASLTDGIVLDAAVAASEREAGELWALRDAIGPALAAMPGFAPFDIAIPLSRMERLVGRMRALFAERWPGRLSLFFGHIGDMNLHAVLRLERGDDVDEVERSVYDLLRGEHASISGEHGVGVLKRAYLPISRGPEEIQIMKRLKQAFDPRGILNPGRIFLSDLRLDDCCASSEPR